MKKLLSTLAIVGITGSGTFGGLITSLNTTINTIHESKADATVDFQLSSYVLLSKDNVYDAIRYQLAKDASADSYAIKYDKKIHVSIFFGSLLLPENTLAQYGTTYKVQVIVDDGDQYFNSATKEVEITVGLEKTDLDITTFTLTTGDNLYTDLAKDASLQAPNGVSLADIQADQELLLEAFDGTSAVKLLPKNTTVEAGKSYTIEAATSSVDKYFNELDQTTYTIGQESNLIDITSETFNSASYMTLGNGQALYTEVRTQMAGWTENSQVTAQTIKDDTNISITIASSMGTTLSDDSNSTLNMGTYSVNITISSSDQYFAATSETQVKSIILT